MLPLRDHHPAERTPIVTWLLLAANILVFGWMLTLSEAQLEEFINQYAVIPSLVVSGENLRSLLTSMFLHGGFAHVLGNMLFLHIFGDNVEDRLGHARFLLFYLFAGLLGSVAQIAVDPSSQIPMLGASGAIAGLMGGYLVLFPHARVDVLWTFGFYASVETVPAYSMLGYWILFQFIAGLGSFGVGAIGGVAYLAHIGGFAFGFVITRLFKHRLRVVAEAQ